MSDMIVFTLGAMIVSLSAAGITLAIVKAFEWIGGRK
jgi:hypothetical protein